MGNPSEIAKRIGGTTALPYGGETGFREGVADFIRPFYKTAADSMPADATAVQKIFTNPFTFSLRLVKAVISGDAGLTAHDTNYAQINILTDDAANGAPVVGAMWQTSLTLIGGVTGTGTWTTDIAKTAQLTGTGITVAAQTVAPGANVFWSIAKVGSGVSVPILTGTLQFTRI
jgi:hypothetical protein